MRVVEERGGRLDALQKDLDAAKDESILKQMHALDADLMRKAHEGTVMCVLHDACACCMK